MRSLRMTLPLVLLTAVVTLGASGPLGIYGIVEKVVFEPNEAAAERIQVWGAFAYVDGGVGGLTASPARKGYMYFRLPVVEAGFSEAARSLIKKEWADLKSVAGTGQAVGFGRWGYIARFSTLDPNAMQPPPNIIYEHNPRNDTTDLRVRPAAEAPINAALYQTNAGIVKLSAATHDTIIKALQAALK